MDVTALYKLKDIQEIFSCTADDGKVVVNIFGQRECGRKSGFVYTDYDALEVAFTRIRDNHKGKSLAFPYKFGCGLANGDWNIVYSLIEKHFCDMEVVIYNLENNQ